MMLTNDPVLGQSLARLRVHGMEAKYHHLEVGLNSRLDAIQAAVLRVKLRHLESWTHARRSIAEHYRQLFRAYQLVPLVTLPVEREDNYHVYNQYVVRIPASVRGPLRDFLSARQIGTEIYYPVPLHLQACFASMGHRAGDFPVAELASRESLALPIYPELTADQQRFVVGSIRHFVDAHSHGLLDTEKAA
jgi:dTDP-4-amino-4,6-dideoxygalactose transaminase